MTIFCDEQYCFFRYQKGILVHLYIDTIFFYQGKVAGEKRLIMKSFLEQRNVSLSIIIVEWQLRRLIWKIMTETLRYGQKFGIMESANRNSVLQK